MIHIEEEIQAYNAFLRLSNFKSSTVKVYSRTLFHYYNFHMQNYPGTEPGQDQVQSYLLMRLEQGKSWSTLNADYSALRKYFKVLRDYPWSLKKLPRPRQDKKMPSILSKEDVARLNTSATCQLRYRKSEEGQALHAKLSSFNHLYLL